ncbi:hypothetical protein SPD48_10115 [Pseudogracilibacillus sp. SE30717A]|uniref:hypothetical protein n=1 Tax=Pseudogracilibacillus sp. SE30717A TaxID=3098293 RepID=UPI00300DD1F2
MHYTILRILLAIFLIYFAWPYIPEAVTQIERIFWGAWLLFLILVIGGNLATLLKMSSPPVMEQKKKIVEEVKQRARNY